MTTLQRRYTYDNALLLKDAGLVAATGNATVAAVAKILDLGGASRIDSRVILDVSAIEQDTGDEVYTVQIQGSTSAVFAAGVVNLGERKFGKASLTGETVDSATGRYELPFTNDLDGTIYQYLRVRTIVAGTIATGINFTAYLAKE